jgi:hypothetical protein
VLRLNRKSEFLGCAWTAIEPVSRVDRHRELDAMKIEKGSLRVGPWKGSPFRPHWSVMMRASFFGRFEFFQLKVITNQEPDEKK